MLGGLAPLIVFTFFKSVSVPNFLSSLTTITKIPFVPIPIYLDEKLTGITLDDYNRSIQVENAQEGDKFFEKVSADTVVLKFGAQKDNIVLTAITALFDRVLKAIADIERQDYKITIFYDNIFILDACLDSFQTNLRDGTDFREITMTFVVRPQKKVDASTSNQIPGENGEITGLTQ
jgi:hypothetical protein